MDSLNVAPVGSHEPSQILQPFSRNIAPILSLSVSDATLLADVNLKLKWIACVHSMSMPL